MFLMSTHSPNNCSGFGLQAVLSPIGWLARKLEVVLTATNLSYTDQKDSDRGFYFPGSVVSQNPLATRG
jgi:hypothetical protein